MVTRRCTQRQFLLRPSRRTNQIIKYSLAVAAERTGVLLHAVCVMSNHWHGVVSDPEGRLPEFLGHCHRLIARAQNAALGRSENLWSDGKTSAVWLVSEEDVLDKIAYVLANPTAAGLVRTPSEWPGVISHRFGCEPNVEMPDVFFDEDGDLPDEVDLSFTRPEIFRELSDEQLLAHIQAAVAVRVRSAHLDMEERGLRFLGRDAVLQQPFDATPKIEERRGKPNPRIAAKSVRQRLHAIWHMLEFLKDYRAAWLAWRNGDRDVTFPFGTYALRIHSGVLCQQPP